MEFYLYLTEVMSCTGKVSIPNGMEFYDLVCIGIEYGIGFQFPTGWNSTNHFGGH